MASTDLSRPLPVSFLGRMGGLNARGSVDTEWILDANAGVTDSGATADPAAAQDFQEAAGWETNWQHSPA
jgi:hypothetical protein